MVITLNDKQIERLATLGLTTLLNGLEDIKTPISIARKSEKKEVRRRKPMTLKQKRDVSRRMKKYWAERRKSSK